MDKMTRKEIDTACHNTLREAGVFHPPVKVESVLEYLELHRDFYNLQNPNFLDKAKHKIQVNGRKLIQIVKKICLHFSAYQGGRSFNYIGGWANTSPVRLTPSHTGHWHVVVDLGGTSATVRSSIRIIRSQLP